MLPRTWPCSGLSVSNRCPDEDDGSKTLIHADDLGIELHLIRNSRHVESGSALPGYPCVARPCRLVALLSGRKHRWTSATSEVGLVTLAFLTG